MKKFYFTFGCAHKNRSKYQVIFAKNESEAHEKMKAMYGGNWAFCYTQEQWAISKASGFFNNLTPLVYKYALDFRNEVAAHAIW